VYGLGLKGIAVLADSDFEFRHHMWQRLVRRAGLNPNDFYLGNVYEANLTEQLASRNVKVVVLLGERALNRFLGENDILRWRGRTVPHPQLPGVWVVPALQPRKLMNFRGNEDEEQLRHPPRFHGIWIRDIHHALRVAKDGFERMPVRYLEDPDQKTFSAFADEYFAALAADPETMLSWDIETPYKAKHSEDESDLEEKENVLDGIILRHSFCFRPGYAVSVPEGPQYQSTVRRLLRTKGIVVVWNGRTFDVPVAEKAGYEVLGVVMDFMDAYHEWQSDLPKGLEWVSSEASDLLPWKHLASAEPAHYSAIDADAALRNALYLKSVLRAAGMWNLFINHVVRLMPLLDAAGKRGNQVDTVKREEIRTKLTAMRDELVEEVQQYVPRQLFVRTRYERLPEVLEGTEDLTGSSWPSREQKATVTAIGKDKTEWDIVFELEDVKTCAHCGLIATNKTEHHKGGKKNNPCKASGAPIELKPWWVPKFFRVEPFNPNSSDQLKAYMRHFGHPIGKDKKDSSKETADATHLKALVKKVGAKFPLYAKTLVIHKVSKTIGTYTPEPDAEGVIHTQYVNSTSTWRLGSRKVTNGTQIQNWGKRKDDTPTENAEEKAALKLAAEARKQIIARPKRKLVQIDSSAVEAVMQGYYMNDVDYMNLASKSIHAWLCCRKLGIEFTPANVDLVKKDHPGLYSKMKVTNYLTNFGGGPKLMHDTYPDDFPTQKIAEETQEDLYRLLPTLRQYHHSVRWEAHTKTFLTTPWGYRHWYYDVFKATLEGTVKLSKDSKRSVAFKPQNSNAAFQKDNLLLVGYSPIEGEPLLSIAELEARWPEVSETFRRGETWGVFMGTNVSIHDSLCLDVPVDLVERAKAVLLAVFTRPIPEMNNLRIGAEVEIGDNWGEMEGAGKLVMDNYTIEQTEGGGRAALAA
jgi:hypothetical protein